MADEKDEVEGQDKEEKPGTSILIPILLIFNMLTMLGVAGVLYWSYINAPQKEGIIDIVTSDTRVREELGEDEAEEDDGEIMGPTFPLDRFIVNLADLGGNKYLNILIDLELSTEDLSDELEKRLPQVRDTVLVLLSSKRYKQIATLDGKRHLREEILNTVNNLLTTGRIKAVYFTNFVVN